MKSPAICFFNSSISWGGGEKWHYDASTHLDRCGISVIAATNAKSELGKRLQSTRIPLFYVSISTLSFFNLFKMCRIYHILKSNHIDTLIMNLPEDLKVAGPAAKLAGVRRIIYRRGSATPIRNSLANKMLFGKIVNGVIANSHHTKRTIIQNNPKLFSDDKIQVIYNGIELADHFKKNEASLYDRQNNEILLGHAGRLSAEKGQMELIKIAAKLKNKTVPFKLLIAGEGKIKNDLKQYAKDLGVESRVVFLGFVKNIDAFMQTIDIFLLTSRYEGFGYVMIEAMAHKKPVVAFDVQSNAEIVENGKTGFLIQGRNIDQFAEKVEFLIHNQDVRDRMGASGKEKVEKDFHIEKTTQQLLKLIDSL